MSFINYSSREINCKIVYYGPGLCGKTTNLQWIHEKLPIKNKGKMLSLATETDRTLFFDFLPLSLGEIEGGVEDIPHVVPVGAHQPILKDAGASCKIHA